MSFREGRVLMSPRAAVAVLAVGALVGLGAGCGSSDDNTSSTGASGGQSTASTGASSTTDGATSTAGGENGVQYAQAQVDKLRQVPDFVAPGPPISDIGKVKGKKIFIIPNQSDVPLVTDVGKTMASLAERAGATATDCPNQGRPSQWAQCVDQAIAQKADVIVLNFAPDPLLLQPQLAKAQKAGIPVVLTHLYDESDPLPPNVTAQVPAGFNRAARAEADWIIADSGGKANVLVIPAMEVHPSKGIVNSMKDEFAKHCPDCKMEVVNIPLVDAATKTQSTIQSALVKDPTINYVVPIYDFAVQYAAPAVVAARAQDRVKIVSWNGTDFALKMLADGKIDMDVGEAPDWLAWANMDQIFRVLAGDEPVEDEKTAQRIWDETNIAEAGDPPNTKTGYGDAYVTGYEKLWNLPSQ